MFSDNLLEKLRSAQQVAVLTGAGVSAESGVPTFRGQDGLWKKYRAEDLATLEAFTRNPKLVWEWYNYRRSIVKQKSPNPGHYALAAMERHFSKFELITQNVDGFHRAAGNKNVYEIHGNIMRNRCVKCNRLLEEPPFEIKNELPFCFCGGLLRPDVVWFGEALSGRLLELSYAAAQNCDVFLSIGTSAVVQPAASLPLIAKENGGFAIEINSERTPISSIVDEVILGKSGEILPALCSQLKIKMTDVSK
ncbi:MAG: NAD-dependent deacylase [bacterium]